MPAKPHRRRALAQTFDPLSSPEARAFVEAGNPAATPMAVPGPTRSAPGEERPSPRGTRPSQTPAGSIANPNPGGTASSPTHPVTPAVTPERENDPLVTVTLRLPATLVARLLRASADRKIRRARPWTQQEIAAEALDHWLETRAATG